jgi:hypothetical protein
MTESDKVSRGAEVGGISTASNQYARACARKAAKKTVEDTYMRLAIIGTAGRRGDADRITLATWDAMLADVRQRVAAAQHTDGGEPLDVTLASGGAAYADHLAVLLWRERPAWRLELFLPAPLGREGFDTSTAAGARTAELHAQFRDQLGIDGVKDLQAAAADGAWVHDGPGFKARNQAIAERADVVLAYTFGPGAEVVTATAGDPAYLDATAAGLKPGGTAQTWQMAQRAAEKVHVPLHLLGQASVLFR